MYGWEEEEEEAEDEDEDEDEGDWCLVGLRWVWSRSSRQPALGMKPSLIASATMNLVTLEIVLKNSPLHPHQHQTRTVRTHPSEQALPFALLPSRPPMLSLSHVPGKIKFDHL